MPAETKIHRSSHHDDIRKMLCEKGSGTTYLELVDIIFNRFAEEYTPRALRYYRHAHIDPEDRLTKITQQKVAEGLEIINVLKERTELYEKMKERAGQLLDLEKRLYLKDGRTRPGTSKALMELNRVLDSLRDDQKAMGLLEPDEQNIIVNANVSVENQITTGPPPLDASPDDIKEFAKWQIEQKNGNGKEKKE